MAQSDRGKKKKSLHKLRVTCKAQRETKYQGIPRAGGAGIFEGAPQGWVWGCDAVGYRHKLNHRNIELVRLEKTSNIIWSNLPTAIKLSLNKVLLLVLLVTAVKIFYCCFTQKSHSMSPLLFWGRSSDPAGMGEAGAEQAPCRVGLWQAVQERG